MASIPEVPVWRCPDCGDLIFGTPSVRGLKCRECGSLHGESDVEMKVLTMAELKDVLTA